MGRTRKSRSSKRARFATFGDLAEDAEEEADLPKDEAGRRKIKRQYAELLGIRIEKLKGRILNRERINKTIEGIYFICCDCLKVCHSLDDGFTEDPNNQQNLCTKCSKTRTQSAAAEAKAASTPSGRSGSRKRASA